nr:FtsX-like permease family protein [Bifidobacterium aemilianum]
MSLLGATARQVLFYTLAQVAVLTLLASLVGVLLAPTLAPMIMRFHVSVFGLSQSFAFAWHGLPSHALLGLAIGLLTAFVAARRTLKDLKEMVPVQSLRQAVSELPSSKHGNRRGLISLCLALVFLLLPAVSSLQLAMRNSASLTVEQVMNTLTPVGPELVLAIILLLVALARSGGTVIGWGTRFWTRLVPVASPVWKIARAQAVVRSRGRPFGSTIVSLTACLLLVGGIFSSTGTMAVSLQLVTAFWAALLIALVGAVASFVISSK